MLTLGQATLEKIVDIDPFSLPIDFILPDADLDELRRLDPGLAPDHVDFATGTLLLGVHSFLLRTGTLNILIDSCVGEDKERPRRRDWHRRKDTGFLRALAGAGLRPDDIDIVMCTHLHADHVGWNTRLDNGRWVPTFPRARYVIGRAELEHWQTMEREEPGIHNHGAFTDSVLPILEHELCEPVDDGFELFDGALIVPLAGHSPGQIGLDLHYGPNAHALFCGDAFHSPVQVYRPDWSSRFCADSELAAGLRRALCERSAGDGTLLLPAHVRGAHGMRVLSDGTRHRPQMV